MFGQKIYKGARHIIVVASGKGGVGKSTVSANLAVSLGKMGYSVGLVDADIYGPSMPTMFGITEKPIGIEKDGKQLIVPIEKNGIKIMSMGFFVKPEQPLIWRGPMASGALKQLFSDTDWGDLDFMIVDLPPGTGDVQLTINQSLDIAGAIVVTTPQQVAIDDVVKAASMFQNPKIGIPIFGIIENMAYFTPKELPDNKYYIFGKDGGKLLAEKLNVPLLAQIPLVQSVSESGDSGKPISLNEEMLVGQLFMQVAEKIVGAYAIQ